MVCCSLRRAIFILSAAVATLHVVAAANITPIAAKPHWQTLERYQETITHDEFTRLLQNVYATRGHGDLIEVSADSARNNAKMNIFKHGKSGAIGAAGGPSVMMKPEPLLSCWVRSSRGLMDMMSRSRLLIIRLRSAVCGDGSTLEGQAGDRVDRDRR